MKKFDVAIIGGGIGGLALAQGLLRNGISVKVYEREGSSHDRLEGYRIHMNPTGTRSLNQVLSPENWQKFLANVGKRDRGFRFLSSDMTELVFVDADIMYPPNMHFALHHYPVDRAVLRDVLLDGLDDVVVYHKQFDSYVLRSDGCVVLKFEDGSEATADLLVGADGARSRVRDQYLPAASLVETGAVAAGFRLPLTPATKAWLPNTLANDMNFVFSSAPFFLFTAAFEQAKGTHAINPAATERGYSDYVLCAFVAKTSMLPDNFENMARPDVHQSVARLLSGWHPTLQRLVKDADPKSVGAFNLKSTRRVSPWKTTNITLLGDAIHSMPPVGGLGGNTALRDAATLSAALADVVSGRKSLLKAVASYESHARKTGYAAIRSALAFERQGLMTNPLGVASAKAWFALCQVARPVREMTFGSTWSHTAARMPWE